MAPGKHARPTGWLSYQGLHSPLQDGMNAPMAHGLLSVPGQLWTSEWAQTQAAPEAIGDGWKDAGFT